MLNWQPRVAMLIGLMILALSHFSAASSAGESFGIQGDKFILNGKPMQIISGEIHYPRIPHEYWRDRLRKARAMGLNTISTYVFWNLHEPKPGTYDFSGDLNVAEFIRIAQQEGLHVILRPGPYVCAEWEFGGYPAWLLKDPRIVLRSTDEKFMRPAEQWLQRLGRELASLQVNHGGPIIAVQIENEYGSFGSDKAYMRRIRDALLHSGFDGALLYTADGPEKLAEGTLPDAPAVVNFGPGRAKEGLAALAAFRPHQPLMIGEYWAGWFDSWGIKHHNTDEHKEAEELDWVLSQGYSINLYMFHGGTSFGFMSGADNPQGNYRPDTTSYDYDAPLDESGRPSRKYGLFRDVIAKYTSAKPADIPVSAPTIAIPEFEPRQISSLFAALPNGIASEHLQKMEAIGQSYGYILYRKELQGPLHGELILQDLRDIGYIFLQEKQVGMLDRRLKQDRIVLDVSAGKAVLDILVENHGRLNFSPEIRNERKGITGASLAGQELLDWKVYPLPISTGDPGKPVAARATYGPGFYRASVDLASVGDTFLDMSTWGEGMVWVNGHNLGRYWAVGPQQTLYLPAPWLKKGKNEIAILDVMSPDAKIAGRKIRGLEKPILDDLHQALPTER